MTEKIIYILLTIIVCFFGSVSALLLKKSGDKIKNITSIKHFIKVSWKSKILIGIIIYIFATFLTIFILRKLEVTVYFPLTSITYIFSFILGKKYFNEKISKNKIIGIVLIILGVILVV